MSTTPLETPILNPSRRLRDKSEVQLKKNISDAAKFAQRFIFPPIALLKAAISTKALVTKAARALYPKAIPSQTPAAMAIMFFRHRQHKRRQYHHFYKVVKTADELLL